jgi:hypothetical protein
MKRILKLSCLLSLGLASILSRAQLSTCDAIHEYFKHEPPGDPYVRVRDMKSAVDFLGQNPADCVIYDVERVRWTYADSLSKFSRTFPNDAATTATWANQAAIQYQNYVEWFFSLDSGELDQLIVAVSGKDRSAPDFASYRRRWIRSRVGNVLAGLGNSYELAHAYSTLIDTYANIASNCVAAGTSCIQAFPAEVVANWHKWLSSLPDFALQKQEAQIRALLRSDDDCKREWGAFRDFLDSYVNANPSVGPVWSPLRRKVTSWLAS